MRGRLTAVLGDDVAGRGATPGRCGDVLAMSEGQDLQAPTKKRIAKSVKTPPLPAQAGAAARGSGEPRRARHEDPRQLTPGWAAARKRGAGRRAAAAAEEPYFDRRRGARRSHRHFRPPARGSVGEGGMKCEVSGQRTSWSTTERRYARSMPRNRMAQPTSRDVRRLPPRGHRRGGVGAAHAQRPRSRRLRPADRAGGGSIGGILQIGVEGHTPRPGPSRRRRRPCCP